MRRWKVQSKVDDAKADAMLDAKVNSMVNSENALLFCFSVSCSITQLISTEEVVVLEVMVP